MSWRRFYAAACIDTAIIGAMKLSATEKTHIRARVLGGCRPVTGFTEIVLAVAAEVSGVGYLAVGSIDDAVFGTGDISATEEALGLA